MWRFFWREALTCEVFWRYVEVRSAMFWAFWHLWRREAPYSMYSDALWTVEALNVIFVCGDLERQNLWYASVSWKTVAIVFSKNLCGTTNKNVKLCGNLEKFYITKLIMLQDKYSPSAFLLATFGGSSSEGS